MEATPPPQQPGHGSQWPAPTQNQPPGTPGYGQPQYPQQPGYGQQPQGPPGGGKLDTAGTFERIFQLYGSQFVILVGAAAIILAPIAIIQGLAVEEASIGLLLVSAVLSIFGNALLTGTVVEAVRDMRDGQRDFGLGKLFASAAPFIVPLIIASLVFAIGAVLSVFALIIGVFFFITFFSLFAPALIVERAGIFGSLQRSRDLVRGNGWRVFGVIIVVAIIGGIVGNIISRIAYSVSETLIGAIIGNLIGSVLTAPLWALGISVLYFQLRDLKEGTQGLSAPAPPPRV